MKLRILWQNEPTQERGSSKSLDDDVWIPKSSKNLGRNPGKKIQTLKSSNWEIPLEIGKRKWFFPTKKWRLYFFSLSRPPKWWQVLNLGPLLSAALGESRNFNGSNISEIEVLHGKKNNASTNLWKQSFGSLRLIWPCLKILNNLTTYNQRFYLGSLWVLPKIFQPKLVASEKIGLGEP